MIEQVKSFKTSDGALHSNKANALTHQFQLDLRGVIQNEVGANSGNLTATQAAQIFAKNAEKIHGITSKYRDAIRRIKI